MMKQELIIKKKELPEWWKIKPLKEVLILHESGTWGPESNEKEGIAVLRSTNFTKDMKLKYEDFAYREIPDKKITQKKLEFNDLLLERSGGGPKQPVGRVVLFNKKEGTYLFGNFIQRLRANTDLILPKFLYYNLFAKYLNGETESMQNNTTNLRNLRYDNFINTAILVPSLPEQQKIVSKLDRQMTQIEMMKREAEREKEASNKLFKSFLNKIFNFKMKEELPSGWKWKNLTELVKYPKRDIVSGPFGSNLVVADYRNEGIPIIRLQNIQRGRFLNKDIKYVSPEKAEELKRHSYLPRDIVIAKLGVPIGKTCIVPENIEKGVVVADVVRIRINEEKNDVHFIEYLLNSDFVTDQLTNKIIGSTRPRVNLNDVRGLILPIPELKIQKDIVKELNRNIENSEKIKEEVINNVSSINQLPSSILNEVFGQYKIPEEV